MTRLGAPVSSALGLLACALAACSHPKPSVTPLPPDPSSGSGRAEATPPPPPPAEKPAPPPVEKLAPHDTVIEAQMSTVKLVAAGTGKKSVPLIVPAGPGKTPVEIHVDFTAKQGDQGTPTPTLILHGDLEVVTSDKHSTEYKITIVSTDTHYPAGMAHIGKLETGLAGLVGMTMSGSVAPNGVAGKVTLHSDAVSPTSAEVMELFKVTWMPSWPVLPDKAIGAGAKWQVTSTYKLANQLDVSEVTDYQLVAVKDKTWSIKGTSKLTGKDQQLEGAMLIGIAGASTIDATLTEGVLVGSLHHQLSAGFTMQQGGQSGVFALEIGNDLGIDSSSR